MFLLRELNPDLRLWDVLVEPARKIRIGNKLFFEDDGPMVAEVIDNTTSRGRTLRFLYDCPHDEFKRELFALGEAPLPRYIVDKHRYPVISWIIVRLLLRIWRVSRPFMPRRRVL